MGSEMCIRDSVYVTYEYFIEIDRRLSDDGSGQACPYVQVIEKEVF